MLTQTQRTNIEGRFQCRLFDHYGSSERVAIIGTCEAGNYHVEPDYSYVEYEDCGDGTRAKDFGSRVEIRHSPTGGADFRDPN